MQFDQVRIITVSLNLQCRLRPSPVRHPRQARARRGQVRSDWRAWTIVRPLFKAEFAIESDDKRILDGLAHLAMKQNENVRDYFGRLNITNTIIMEAYDSYTVLPVEPVLTGNVQNDTAAMRAHVRARDINLAKFFSCIRTCCGWDFGGNVRGEILFSLRITARYSTSFIRK